MRLAVLCAPDSWYFRDLLRAAESDHEVRSVPFSLIQSSIGDLSIAVASGGHQLSDVDAVLVRTMPPGSLEQVVFRMDALASLAANGVLVVNPPKAIESAVDKYLTLARLARAGIPVPATVTCQSIDDALRAFHALGRDVVVKPLFGSEGRGLIRLTDEDLAERAFKSIIRLGSVAYIQQFIDHPGFDTRVLVIGKRLLAIRRHQTGDWRTNISRGARAEVVEVTGDLAELATRSGEAVGATLAGVDILTDRAGRQYVIEVNAVPGWRGAAKAWGVDIARLVLDHVQDLVEQRHGMAL